MSQSSIEAEAEFNAYAAEYDALLAQGISISGEDKNYFASGRVVWLARCLACLQKHPRTAMDFGCGTGSATPFLLNELKLDELVGLDASVQSLAIARHAHGNRARFVPLAEYRPEGLFDLVFCNGVFHHIPPGDRIAAIGTVYSSLRPGGLFAFWENNPWNPGTDTSCAGLHLIGMLSLVAADRPPFVARMWIRNHTHGFLVLLPEVSELVTAVRAWPGTSPTGCPVSILCRKPEGMR